MQDVAKNFEHGEHFSADRQQARPVQDVSRCVTMYVELITILVRAKDDITRACRRCQSTLYIVFNIAKVGGPHYGYVIDCSRLAEMEYSALSRPDSKMHWFCEGCAHSALSAVKSDNLVEERCKQFLDSFRAEYDSKVTKLSEDLEAFKDTQNVKNANLESQVEKISAKAAGEAIDEVIERDKMKRNLVLFNVPESVREDPQARMEEDYSVIQDLCNHALQLHVEFTKVVRLGKLDERARPLRASCESEKQVFDILKASRKLKENQTYSNIIIKRDQTPLERKQVKELLQERDRRSREASQRGEEANWSLRGGKIINTQRRLPTEETRVKTVEMVGT